MWVFPDDGEPLGSKRVVGLRKRKRK